MHAHRLARQGNLTTASPQECLEYSHAFLQAECSARSLSCAACGSVWGCLPKTLLASQTAEGSGQAVLGGSSTAEFRCPTPCDPTTSPSCALLMVPNPSKPIFPTDLRCIVNAATGECVPNCNAYGPVACQSGVGKNSCGHAVIEGTEASPNYFGWWECGRDCLAQIEQLGLCSVSSYTAADWNLTSGVVPPATATHYPVTRTRVSSKLPYTSTPSTTASSTAEAIVTPPASGSSGSPWTIVGATIGGIVSAIVLAIALFLLARRKPRRGHNEDEAQPLKRGGSPEMMEAGIDSGRMDLGPSLGMGAGAASASSGAGGGGRSMPNRSRPTSIWDPSYVPEPVVRKASVTAPTTRSIVAISSLAEPASVVIAAGPPVRAAAGARTSLPPLPRSSSVPTIHEDILSRPKSLVVAPGASAETRSISGGSDGGMRAYPAGIGRTAAGYDTYSRGIEHDDDDESYMGIGMSRYSSLGEASMAELHRVMMEEAAAAQPPEVSVVQTPLLPKLALPSLNSVRTSVHSEHGVLPPSGVAARPLPDPQAFQPAPLAQLVPPAANPSMILPAFPSVRQQTMAANSASPATSDSQAPYRMPSYYVEPSERFADA